MRRLEPIARVHGTDLLIAAAAAVSAVDVIARSGASNNPDSPTAVAAAISALLFMPLLARRRRPFGAPVSVWLLAAAVSFFDGRLVPFSVGATVGGLAAAFLLGQLPDARRARAGLAVVVVAALVIVLNDPGQGADGALFVPVPFIIAWIAGLALRDRTERAELAEERARQAEREREAAATLAVAEERMRIARELHDVVAHALSVMVLQTGAVRHNLPAEQAEDRHALAGIESVGRSALSDMRHLLGALRRRDERADLSPQPGLGSLEPLLEQVRGAGLDVGLEILGEPVELAPTLDLSAYRIVQEGLTNVLKHADADRAEVSIRFGGDDLVIEVRDDGRGGSATDGHGNGLVGMRERVAIYGGEMTAGPSPDGGYSLSARLPVGTEAAA